jgi:hypothetical protein
VVGLLTGLPDSEEFEMALIALRGGIRQQKEGALRQSRQGRSIILPSNNMISEAISFNLFLENSTAWGWPKS